MLSKIELKLICEARVRIANCHKPEMLSFIWQNCAYDTLSAGAATAATGASFQGVLPTRTVVRICLYLEEVRPEKKYPINQGKIPANHVRLHTL